MEIIKFKDEKLSYKVISKSYRYMVCTRPIDKKVDKKIIKSLTEEELKTVPIYTIVDLKESIRSPHNLIFNPYDFSEKVDCDKCLDDVVSGKIELSSRNKVDLQIEYIRRG